MLKWLLAFLLLSAPATADNRQKLADTLKELETTSEKAQQLSAEIADVTKELTTLEQKRQAITDRMRSHEKRISEKRANIAALQQNIATQQRALQAKRDNVGKLVYGMIRMQRLPRHYVMAQPEDTETLLRTASALNVTYGAAEHQFASLLTAQRKLDASLQSLNEEKTALDDEKAAFSAEATALRATLASAKQMKHSLGTEQSRAKERITNLSQQASSLRELLDGLAQENAFLSTLKPTMRPKDAGAPPSFSSRKGRLELPEGRLKYRFAQKTAEGKHRGWTLQTAGQALVKAVHDGHVVFAGPFMEYGNMVIIRHDSDWHTVSAGMDVLYAESGEKVRQNSVLGVMGDSIATRDLYIEVRRGSNPVDPAPWMRKVRTLAGSR